MRSPFFRFKIRGAVLALAALVASSGAHAGAAPGSEPGLGKLLLTGGVASIDGAAGGGLVPWAVTAGYATEGEVGGAAHVTRLKTQDYGLTTFGAAFSYSDRLEATLARQQFDAHRVVPGTTLKLDIFGVKWKVAGDAILDADRWMPQVALGVEWKRLDPGPSVGPILASVGAKTHGVDLYVSATKLFLDAGVLVNATVRATRANQNGLLGFRSTEQGAYRLQPEVSAALLLRRSLAVGLEYRSKPNRLAFAGDAYREEDWADAFIAWAPNKRVSVTAAWVELGNIVGRAHQHGPYLSAQLTF